MVAVGIGQGVVGVGHSEFTVACPAAVDEHILILDFAHGRSFVETEGVVLLITGDKVLDALAAGLQRGHGLGVQLGAPRLSETPVGIGTAVVVDKGGGVEVQDAVGLVRLPGLPVANLERTVGALAFGHHGLPAAVLRVGVEVVGLGAVGFCHHGNVGGKQHVGLSYLIEQVALGIGLRLKDNPIIAPVVQVFNGSRPHHLVGSAVLRAIDVVRPVDIHAVFAGVVGVLEDVGFTVGDVLPQRQIGVGSRCVQHGCYQ